MQHKDGNLIQRDKGTPQGGVISPLLANLYLHYAFDHWMRIHYPRVPFERYADDIIIHFKFGDEASRLRKHLEARLRECKLELHPTKTKVVYCKDADRKANFPNTSFEFLGYEFRPRGWIQYYGKYYKSALFSLAEQINRHLVKWVANKYKNFRRKQRRAMHALGKIARK